MASKTEIISAYRNLYRLTMRAIRYTRPQTLIARAQLRQAFNPLPGTPEYGQSFDADAVKKMTWFMQAADRQAGLEHRMLKNVLAVAGVRQKLSRVSWSHVKAQNKKMIESQKAVAQSYEHYDRTLDMLHKTMGLRFK